VFSRGPTREEHIRTDVVAPETFILSANSEHNGHPDHPHNDPQWAYLSGTSMAALLVAGCAAVLREAVIKSWSIEPSAALVKTLII
jgi:serine protease AprX